MISNFVLELIQALFQKYLAEKYPAFAYLLFASEFIAAFAFGGICTGMILFYEFDIWLLIWAIMFLPYMSMTAIQFYEYQIKRERLTVDQVVSKFPHVILIVIWNASCALIGVGISAAPAAIAILLIGGGNFGWFGNSVCAVVACASVALSIYVGKARLKKEYYFRF